MTHSPKNAFIILCPSLSNNGVFGDGFSMIYCRTKSDPSISSDVGLKFDPSGEVWTACQTASQVGQHQGRPCEGVADEDSVKMTHGKSVTWPLCLVSIRAILGVSSHVFHLLDMCGSKIPTCALQSNMFLLTSSLVMSSPPRFNDPINLIGFGYQPSPICCSLELTVSSGQQQARNNCAGSSENGVHPQMAT